MKKEVYSRIVQKGGKRPDGGKLSAALEATSFPEEKSISALHLGPAERGTEVAIQTRITKKMIHFPPYSFF